MLVWWLERLLAIPSSGWFRPDGAFALGGDLRSLQAAAWLATHGNGHIVYDADAFRAFSGAGESGAFFAHPPPFLGLLAPLGWVSFETAWWVLAGLSAVGTVAALRMLGVTRAATGSMLALVFPPVYFAVTFGQVSVVWVLILAAVYRLVTADRPRAAGIVAGLMVMKPPLAIGLALWWLIDWGRFRVVATTAAAAAVGYLGVSYLVLRGVWPGFIRSFPELYFEPIDPLRQWAQFSLWSSWNVLFPTRPGLVLVAGVIFSAAAVGMMIPVVRRAGSTPGAFAAGTVLVVLVAPYVIAYDWALLLIPGVLLWLHREEDRSWLAIVFALVTVVSAWSTVLVLELIDRFGFAVQLAPLVLLVVVWRGRAVFPGLRPRLV